MAEFKQVMNDWYRMCKKYFNGEEWICDKECPMYPYSVCSKPTAMYPAPLEFDAETVSLYEEIIEAWAEKHIVVYPTWGEWLQSIGVAQLGSGMLSIHSAVAEQPIPVETAKKLGLNPKEG